MRVLEAWVTYQTMTSTMSLCKGRIIHLKSECMILYKHVHMRKIYALVQDDPICVCVCVCVRLPCSRGNLSHISPPEG